MASKVLVFTDLVPKKGSGFWTTTVQQVFEGGGGGISPLFLLNYFLFNLFLFLQKKSSAQSLVDQLLRQIATALFVNK